MAATVLVVEDERKLRDFVRSYLERAGFTVLSTGSGAEALSMAADASPDLVVLDLGLPDVPGETVARELRAAGPTPILILTAKSAEEDRIRGLELGADDYVTKPFSPRELVLRVQAILRRGAGQADAQGVTSYGGGALVIDEPQRRVTVRGAEAGLTPTEWGVLVALATVPGRVYSRFELINRVRGYEFEGYERTVDSHVKNLRRKVEQDPANRQRAELTSAIAVAAGAAWDRNNSWASAYLSPVLDLATPTGADVRIRDQAGKTVAASPGFDAQHGPQSGAAVVVRGQKIGTVMVRFTGAGLGAAGNVLESALLRAIAGAAGLAALLALLTGLAVARRITRPVSRLIAVTRAMAGGDRAARAGQLRAPAELRELAAAFDQMANTLDRQEQIRRDLVADVAHELRTPVAVLQAGHEALVDGVAEPTPAELTSLRDEVLRLARMVNDLQTLAAADAAALHLARQPCDLADLAVTAADSLTRRFEAAGITLDQRLATAPVLADPHWLHQVITNLLTNALKFTPPGGRVEISTGPAEAAGLPGPGAVLQVTDTGVGIAPDDLPHIFDRFWRGRDASQISGTGIGLAIAAELAQAHGGRLAAASEPGQGTWMTLTLPAA